MIRKRVIISLFIGALLLQGNVMAQEGAGGTRSVFTIGAGSRAISMGGAFTAIGNDPSVLYYNPAGLRSNPYASIMANHIQLFSGFSDATYDYIGAVYPTLNSGSVGIGIITTGTGGIRAFNENSIELEEITYRESQGVLGYAFDVPYDYIGDFTAGVSIKILNQRIGDYSDTGVGMDLGLLYRHDYLRGLVLGCNVQDAMGAEIKLQSISERVDRTIMLGAGYSYRFENGSVLTAAAQFDMPQRADNDVRFGIEYVIKKLFSVRFGFDSEKVTAGIGFNWKGYGFDYGYFSRDEAGSSHPVTLISNFGESIDEKKLAVEERRRLAEERLLREAFSARVSEHLDRGRGYIQSEEFEKAYDEFKMALEYDPSNEEAGRLIADVESKIMERQRMAIQSAEKRALIDRHTKLGLQYYRNNEYLLSQAEWNALLEIDPGNESAESYLERIREKLAEQIAMHRERARENESIGKLAEALDEWNLVRTLDPGSEEAQREYSRIKERLTELSQNLESAREELQIIDMFETALSHFSQGDYTRAEDILSSILARRPDHAEARTLLEKVRRRMVPLTEGQKAEIRRLYIEGMEHFTQERYRKAIDLWERVLKIDPENESIIKNIEEARSRLNKIGQEETD